MSQLSASSLLRDGIAAAKAGDKALTRRLLREAVDLEPENEVAWLWLAGRYSSTIYALSTKDGHVLARIAVGVQPHGLCVWPQPGRYSLGHTGVTR